MIPNTRERLLARHAHAVPALDALRRAALPEPSLSPAEFLRELVFPVRFIWSALALTWLLILGFHLASPRSLITPQTTPGSVILCSTSTAQLNALFNETRALR